jgi:integrase
LAGVGQAEAAGLLGEHVDFERRELQFLRQKTKVGFVVPLFPQVQPLLEKLRQAGRIKAGHPVFRVRNVKKGLAAACRRLAFPSFTPRSLRRMFIVRCLEKGVDARVVAGWQGHSDNGVLIMRVYSRFINTAHAERMAALLS